MFVWIRLSCNGIRGKGLDDGVLGVRVEKRLAKWFCRFSFPGQKHEQQTETQTLSVSVGKKGPQKVFWVIGLH